MSPELVPDTCLAAGAAGRPRRPEENPGEGN